MEPLIYDGVANGFAMRNGAFGATAEADLFAFTDVVPDSWAALARFIRRTSLPGRWLWQSRSL
ncbi:MAG: hypothetical protein RR288_01175 [Oscillibacter sp.]